jgi:hypothetical protein
VAPWYTVLFAALNYLELGASTFCRGSRKGGRSIHKIGDSHQVIACAVEYRWAPKQHDWRSTDRATRRSPESKTMWGQWFQAARATTRFIPFAVDLLGPIEARYDLGEDQSGEMLEHRWFQSHIRRWQMMVQSTWCG